MYTYQINNNIIVYGSHSLVEALKADAEALARAEAQRKAEQEERNALACLAEKLNSFTEADFALGHAIARLGYEMWHSLPSEVKAEGYVFCEKAVAIYIATYVAVHPEVSEEQCRRGVEASELASTYSDWHKDIYGYRPR